MKTNISFTKHGYFAFISTTLIILGFIFTLTVRGGFNLGIDFKAGLNQQIKISSDQDISRTEVFNKLESIKGINVQVIGDKADNAFMLKVQDSGEDNFQTSMTESIKSLLDVNYGASNVAVTSTEFVGGTFSSNLTSEVIFMVSFALLLILAYVWIRFKLNYAISSIVALLHDVLFMLAFIGASGLEINTGTIAAILTIIGYSLNDTIVIFDRVRENDKHLKVSYSEKVNISLNESLSRTLMTSITTLIAVVSIAVFATGQVQQFAFNLIVGVVVGTYSSIFIASNVAIIWHNKVADKVNLKYGKKTDNLSVVK